MKTTYLFPTILIALNFLSCSSSPTISDSGPSAANRDPATVREDFEEFEKMRAEQRNRQELVIRQAQAQRDIVLGMSADDVRSVWGDPRSVETAGDSGSGNEKWTYYEGLSAPWSMSSTRTIFFENGKVVGWQTGRN